MKDCWALNSELRPAFAILVQNLSTYLESMASYVMLNDTDSHDYSGVGIPSCNVEKNHSPTDKFKDDDIDTTIM